MLWEQLLPDRWREVIDHMSFFANKIKQNNTDYVLTFRAPNMEVPLIWKDDFWFKVVLNFELLRNLNK